MTDVINDHGKLLLLLIALVGGIGLAFVGNDVGAPIVTAVLGYITGNGVLAVRRKAPSLALVPKMSPDDPEYVHRGELDELAAWAAAQSAQQADAHPSRGTTR